VQRLDHQRRVRALQSFGRPTWGIDQLGFRLVTVKTLWDAACPTATEYDDLCVCVSQKFGSATEIGLYATNIDVGADHAEVARDKHVEGQCWQLAGGDGLFGCGKTVLVLQTKRC